MENETYMKRLKDRLQIEFKKQDRSGVYGFTQRSIAYNSNRIEGSSLTEKQTASMFETGTLYADDPDMIFRTKDIEEMNGHFKMFNFRRGLLRGGRRAGGQHGLHGGRQPRHRREPAQAQPRHLQRATATAPIGSPRQRAAACRICRAWSPPCPSLTTDKAVQLFGKFGVFTRAELESRSEIMYETYTKVISIEARTMLHMAGKHYIPAVVRNCTRLADSVCKVHTACPAAPTACRRRCCARRASC